MFLFKKPKSDQPQLRYYIDKMHCTSCASNIDLTLEDLPGVISSNTSYAKSILTLTYDPNKLNQTLVLDTIKGLGYTATIL